MNARDKGAKARRDGVPRRLNPYQRWKQRNQWNTGWHVEDKRLEADAMVTAFRARYPGITAALKAPSAPAPAPAPAERRCSAVAWGSDQQRCWCGLTWDTDEDRPPCPRT